MKDIQLDQLKGKKPGAEPPLGGILQARALIEGKGDSIHDLMANADGRVSVVLPEGEVRAAFAELTGINVARGIGLLLKGDDEKAIIRCGVAQFDVRDGKMLAQNVVFDTQDVRITGSGEVRLGPEELDLEIKGEPKKLRFARLRTPVEINGHLRKPAIGVDAGKTAKQGAVAAALGALTPVAAVLAFIDPGLAKDENCAALLSTGEAQRTKSAAKAAPVVR
jgi:AsmA family protein